MTIAPAAPTTVARAPMAPLVYRVASRVAESADTVTLDLEPIGDRIVAPGPGQFTMLYAFGVGEVPISVSGCVGADGLLRHTIRDAGTVTHALCGLGVGEPLGVRGPFGRGWPDVPPGAPDLLVVAGGIGLAPLRPVIERAGREPATVGRVTVLVGARSPDGILFRSELAQWADEPGIDVELTIDGPAPGWYGHVGFVTELLTYVAVDPTRTVAMVCGPEVMMEPVAHRLVHMGVGPDRIAISLERNMHCAIGHCGHCQLGPLFVCAGGPVVPWTEARPLLEARR